MVQKWVKIGSRLFVVGSCVKLGSCVKTGSRLFVVGFMCQNWFTIVRGWFMCQNWFTIVHWLVHVKIGSRLFVVQKHSSGDFNKKNIKENAVSSILCLYLYSLPSVRVVYILQVFFKFNVLFNRLRITNKDITTEHVEVRNIVVCSHDK
jgi:hypothetical protein